MTYQARSEWPQPTDKPGTTSPSFLTQVTNADWRVTDPNQNSWGGDTSHWNVKLDNRKWNQEEPHEAPPSSLKASNCKRKHKLTKPHVGPITPCNWIMKRKTLHPIKTNSEHEESPPAAQEQLLSTSLKPIYFHNKFFNLHRVSLVHNVVCIFQRKWSWQLICEEDVYCSDNCHYCQIISEGSNTEHSCEKWIQVSKTNILCKNQEETFWLVMPFPHYKKLFCGFSFQTHYIHHHWWLGFVLHTAKWE